MLLHVCVKTILLLLSLTLKSPSLFVKLLSVSLKLLLLKSHLPGQLLKHLDLLACLLSPHHTSLVAVSAHAIKLIITRECLALATKPSLLLIQSIALVTLFISCRCSATSDDSPLAVIWPIAVTLIKLIAIVIIHSCSLTLLLGSLSEGGLPDSLLCDNVIITLVVSTSGHLEHFLSLGLSHSLALDG